MQFFVDKYNSMPPPAMVGRGLSAYFFRQRKPMLLMSEDVAELITRGEIESVGTEFADLAGRSDKDSQWRHWSNGGARLRTKGHVFKVRP